MDRTETRQTPAARLDPDPDLVDEVVLLRQLAAEHVVDRRERRVVAEPPEVRDRVPAVGRYS